MAQANYWPRVTFWEELKKEITSELLNPKGHVLVRPATCFARSVIWLFTTPLLSQFFCNCSASIVLPLNLFRLSVMACGAEEKQRSQLQLVHGMAM
jgi:hypothetical protein